MEHEPRRPAFRWRRSAARERELTVRDRLARVLGFVIGVAATAFFAFHRPRYRRTNIPALVDISATAAWCTLGLATLAFAVALFRVESDDLGRCWITLLAASYAAVWVLRLILLLTA